MRLRLKLRNNYEQSFSLHAVDILADLFLLRTDFLDITDIWVDAAARVYINNLQLVHQLPCERRDDNVVIIQVE